MGSDRPLWRLTALPRESAGRGDVGLGRLGYTGGVLPIAFRITFPPLLSEDLS